MAAGIAGWVSVVLGALLASIEVGLSGTAPFLPLVKLMLIYHSVIGVIEGVLTGALVMLLQGQKEDEETPVEVKRA